MLYCRCSGLYSDGALGPIDIRIWGAAPDSCFEDQRRPCCRALGWCVVLSLGCALFMSLLVYSISIFNKQSLANLFASSQLLHWSIAGGARTRRSSTDIIDFVILVSAVTLGYVFLCSLHLLEVVWTWKLAGTTHSSPGNSLSLPYVDLVQECRCVVCIYRNPCHYVTDV